MHILHNQNEFADDRNRPWFDQLFDSSDKRLSRELFSVLPATARKDGPNPSFGMIFQETLAELMGTTRADVFINKFKKLALFTNGGLHAHSSLLNVVLYD